ncbi:L-rhamnose-binding lectin CSL1-like isoform X1 [Ostrea edulis]|uniref:L-rhamnose-binding lectin CSL1-like isoform X1 n=1 Tax=Ostrea edulis TaxID=37623 RepID=UPI00209619C4|nr:L-rhamnose-binding lectin CSL1-like isoform X1 [Ostrea edulis]
MNSQNLHYRAQEIRMKVYLVLAFLLASVHCSLQQQEKQTDAVDAGEGEPVQLPARDVEGELTERSAKVEGEDLSAELAETEDEKPIQLPARDVDEYLTERSLKGIRRTFACENQRLNLQCGRGKEIRVLYTVHSRSNWRCSGFRNKCWTWRTHSQVKKSCNGRRSCRVRAKGRCQALASSVNVVYTCRKNKKCSRKCVKNAQCIKGRCRCKKGFRWSRKRKQCVRRRRRCGKKCGKNARCFRGKCRCRRGYRWNKGKRRCTRRPRRSNGIQWFRVGKGTACEHKDLTLVCGRGRVIRVFYAVYGRLNKKTCAKGKPVKTTKCRAKNSKKLVTNGCDGKRICRMKASNSVFGDPCRGTFKYLTVIYGCRRHCVKHAVFNGKICKCKKGYSGNGFRRCFKKKKVGRNVEEEEAIRDVRDEEGLEINEDELEVA